MGSKYAIILIVSLLILNSLTTGLQVVDVTKAQFTGSIIIDSDGLVIGTSSIQRNGDEYTLISNLSSCIQVQKSNIVIDGAGFAINNADVDLTNKVSSNPLNPQIYNVTIKNLMIVNGSVKTNGGGNNTFYNDYIADINLYACSYNNITCCKIGGIQMNYGSDFNIITQNNLDVVLVYRSSNMTVDKNYWRDYLTKYPNAKEIDNTGIGNQPYVYSIVETRTPLIYQDNHPLMKPVIVPLTSKIEASTPSHTFYEILLSIAGLLALAVTVSLAVILRIRKKQK